MKFLRFDRLQFASRKGREVLRRALHGFSPLSRPSVSGRFQPYNYTLPDRYPWLFEFARDFLGDATDPRVLSFGCSRGEEVFALRQYFPQASILGIDIDPENILRCNARLKTQLPQRTVFKAAASTESEPSAHYDAIFCLAVLCHGDLSAYGVTRCDPVLYFSDFERLAVDLARCLKPGGLLMLHTANFRFCDTSASIDFDVVLEAKESQLARDVVFDRANRLIPDERYRPVGFCKRLQDPTA